MGMSSSNDASLSKQARGLESLFEEEEVENNGDHAEGPVGTPSKTRLEDKKNNEVMKENEDKNFETYNSRRREPRGFYTEESTKDDRDGSEDEPPPTDLEDTSRSPESNTSSRGSRSSTGNQYEDQSYTYYRKKRNFIEFELDSDEGEMIRRENVSSRYNLRNHDRKDSGLERLKKDRLERRKSLRYNLRPVKPPKHSPNHIPWSVVDQFLQETREKEAVEEFPSVTSSHSAFEPQEPNVPAFSRIAGMEDYVHRLKEMIVFPMKYPQLFTKLNITPPRGVLFYGPPGTGKTLMARLLAESCSTPERKVTFFMRNGSDCLSKWIGEAERTLKLLFQKAKECQPSIIFFDELDGLAPERSGKADQSHISLVSTLLALMDGLDDRGNVIVIGATNRIHALDPALRRPGRFDREFYFPLPDEAVRREIIKVHTRHWKPALDESLVAGLAKATFNFAGADLKALCTEAAFRSLRRSCPQAYDEGVLSNIDAISVEQQDFATALVEMIPSTRRNFPSDPPILPPILDFLFGQKIIDLAAQIDSLFGVPVPIGPLGTPSYFMTNNWLLVKSKGLPMRYANRLISAALARLSNIQVARIIDSNTSTTSTNSASSLYQQLKDAQQLSAAKPTIALLPPKVDGEAISAFIASEMIFSEPFLLLQTQEEGSEDDCGGFESFEFDGTVDLDKYAEYFCRNELFRLLKRPDAAMIEREAAMRGIPIAIPVFDYDSIILANDDNFKTLLMPSLEQWQLFCDNYLILKISACQDVQILERELSMWTRKVLSIYPSLENLINLIK